MCLSSCFPKRVIVFKTKHFQNVFKPFFKNVVNEALKLTEVNVNYANIRQSKLKLTLKLKLKLKLRLRLS